MHYEKTLETETLYRGKIISLRTDTVELENGKPALREVVEHPGGVAVLALDEAQNVLMVRQFRYAYGELVLELPAGKLEPGEDPAVAGLRELEEETGHTAECLIDLGKVYPSPGILTETLHLYQAQGLQATSQHLDEDEFLTVERIPLTQALQLCQSREIRDAKTLVALYRYAFGQGITL